MSLPRTIPGGGIPKRRGVGFPSHPTIQRRGFQRGRGPVLSHPIRAKSENPRERSRFIPAGVARIIPSAAASVHPPDNDTAPKVSVSRRDRLLSGGDPRRRPPSPVPAGRRGRDHPRARRRPSIHRTTTQRRGFPSLGGTGFFPAAIPGVGLRHLSRLDDAAGIIPERGGGHPSAGRRSRVGGFSSKRGGGDPIPSDYSRATMSPATTPGARLSVRGGLRLSRRREPVILHPDDSAASGEGRRPEPPTHRRQRPLPSSLCLCLSVCLSVGSGIRV